MEFDLLIEKRHSVRNYSGSLLKEEVLDELISKARLAPSSRNKKPVGFAKVLDPEMLTKLSVAKAGGSQMLEKAGGAIVVYGDGEKSDVWIEDCSIAMTYLHLAAVDMGLGSCWVQLRKRQTKDGKDSALYVKELLGLSQEMQVLAVLSLGQV